MEYKRKKILSIFIFIIFSVSVPLISLFLQFRDNQEENEITIQMQNVADKLVQSKRYIEAIEQYNGLFSRVSKERNKGFYNYIVYMKGKCYLLLSQERPDGEEGNLENAKIQFEHVINAGYKDSFYVRAQEELGYIYWGLSKFRDTELNLVRSMNSYEKAAEMYKADSSLANDFDRVVLNKKRVEYILTQTHGAIGQK